jgi:hypothetical protein
MAAHPDVEFWHFCPECTRLLAELASETGGFEGVRVHQVPGSDRDMRDAGLDADADATAAEAARLRRLFGTP